MQNTNQSHDRLQFSVRLGYPLDHPLIVDSWIQSDRHSVRARSAGRVYLREQKLLIREVLQKPMVVVRVAHVPDEPDGIYGWTVLELGPVPVLHYTYVKEYARMNGIARALLHDLETKDCEYAYRPVFESLQKKIPDNWTFNPYRAW